jgi:PPK2 family polyphosphate:nucleotide phosphotransferase
MKTINIEDFIAKPKAKIKSYTTSYKGDIDKEIGKVELEKVKKKMDELQEKIYASGTKSLLIIFQAMDAAGKDSAIEHVMSGLNPQGCQVYSFKTPNSEEYKHDFLWRHYKALPERGKIGIHNRSHYENVLVCKVHPEYVLSENIPGFNDVKDIDNKFWKSRYESIRSFEKHLTDSGTTILKIFLNVSKEEQKQRFLDRIEDPAKNWKFAEGDLAERALWDKYMEAYETAFEETSTKNAPWYVVPADKKWYARLVISQIVLNALQEMELKFPVLPKDETNRLEESKQRLLNEN